MGGQAVPNDQQLAHIDAHRNRDQCDCHTRSDEQLHAASSSDICFSRTLNVISLPTHMSQSAATSLLPTLARTLKMISRRWCAVGLNFTCERSALSMNTLAAPRCRVTAQP